MKVKQWGENNPSRKSVFLEEAWKIKSWSGWKIINIVINTKIASTSAWLFCWYEKLLISRDVNWSVFFFFFFANMYLLREHFPGSRRLASLSNWIQFLSKNKRKKMILAKKMQRKKVCVCVCLREKREWGGEILPSWQMTSG